MSRENFRHALSEIVPQLPQPEAPAMPPRSPITSASPLPFLASDGLPIPQHAHPTFQGQGGQREALPDPLPDFKSMLEIKEGQLELPKLLIHGLLHRGCKMVLSGGSKSFKSWSLIDLGLSLANGLPWWGNQCEKGRVLYINFELIEGFFEQRLLTVSHARGLGLSENFLCWNLRGKCYDLVTLSRVLKARIGQMEDIDLIIVDPIYKALGDYDENSAGDMGHLMREIESLSETTGAAVIFGAHFSKGSQSHKSAIDRVAGSGVFARDPDAILTMTGHEEQGSFIVESELRYLAPLPPFVVTWNYPLMVPDESKDPTDFWDPTKKSKEEKTNPGFTPFGIEDIFGILPHTGLQDPAWKTITLQRFGAAGKAFYQFKNELIEAGRVIKKNGRFYPANLELHP